MSELSLQSTGPTIRPSVETGPASASHNRIYGKPSHHIDAGFLKNVLPARPMLSSNSVSEPGVLASLGADKRHHHKRSGLHGASIFRSITHRETTHITYHMYVYIYTHAYEATLAVALHPSKALTRLGVERIDENLASGAPLTTCHTISFDVRLGLRVEGPFQEPENGR